MRDHFDPLKHLREHCNCQVYLDNFQNVCLRFGPGSDLTSIMSAQSVVKRYNTQLQLRLKNQCIISHFDFAPIKPTRNSDNYSLKTLKKYFAA